TSGEPGGEPVAEIAHHYERAWELRRSSTSDEPTTARLAVRYLGRQAERTLAFQARLAEATYVRAIELARMPEAAIEPRMLAALLIGRAESLIEMGRHREAIADAHEARTLARRTGDGSLTARALLALGRCDSDLGNLTRA